LDTVRELSEGATIAEILGAIVVAATIRRGEEAGDAGRVVSHDELRKRLASWMAYPR
jgi:predicted transcriptional regulator